MSTLLEINGGMVEFADNLKKRAYKGVVINNEFKGVKSRSREMTNDVKQFMSKFKTIQ